MMLAILDMENDDAEVDESRDHLSGGADDELSRQWAVTTEARSDGSEEGVVLMDDLGMRIWWIVRYGNAVPALRHSYDHEPRNNDCSSDPAELSASVIAENTAEGMV